MLKKRCTKGNVDVDSLYFYNSNHHGTSTNLQTMESSN